MALFFDHQWYDARLGERGLDRLALAAAAGLSPEDLDLVFKDQREIGPDELAVFAEMVGVSREEAARRAGVGGHAAPADPADRRVALLEARVAALEAQVAGLLARFRSS
ncbi:DNA-binding protein [Caulobacter endophyticus]|uniref:DNA-binding protein n=1 Tax=Caulobacter endophyticus TaxID=2172652 RepID=A0A2T9JQ57_9CAUL|nr:DNA-binding protein [Caulobacter endophyticus]PVM85847.1 DNA-binding protein [Caulobacter endophyticus]